MRIMSLNVWSDYADNPVEPREDGILNVIKEYSPDMFGFQEFSPNFYKSNLFREITKDYQCVAVRENTWTPVFFKKSLYTLQECGWVWFDELPPLPYIDDSKTITWAVVTENETGKKFGMCSTHFWFKTGEEHDQARVRNAEQLYDKMSYIREKYNAVVFAVGDFNCSVNSDALNFLEQKGIYTSFKLTDDHSMSASYHGYPVLGDDGNFHGKPAQKDYTSSIDHILTYKDSVCVTKQNLVINEEILGSTDHSPIYADIEIL